MCEQVGGIKQVGVGSGRWGWGQSGGGGVRQVGGIKQVGVGSSRWGWGQAGGGGVKQVGVGSGRWGGDQAGGGGIKQVGGGVKQVGVGSGRWGWDQAGGGGVKQVGVGSSRWGWDQAGGGAQGLTAARNAGAAAAAVEPACLPSARHCCQSIDCNPSRASCTPSPHRPAPLPTCAALHLYQPALPRTSIDLLCRPVGSVRNTELSRAFSGGESKGCGGPTGGGPVPTISHLLPLMQRCPCPLCCCLCRTCQSHTMTRILAGRV